MENLAAISTASRWCDEYKVDKESAVDFVIKERLPIGKEPYKSYYQGKLKEFEKIVGEHGINAFCTVAYKMYGPEGTSGATLIMKR